MTSLMLRKESTHKIEYSAERLRLHELYQQVRDARLKNDMTNIPSVWKELKNQFSERLALRSRNFGDYK